MIPSRKECMELLRRHNVPRGVIHHSLAVRRVAVFLAKELNKKGFNLNIKEIEAAALLHDIKKIDSLKDGTSHAHEGWRLLRKLGYPTVAEIVKQHVFLNENNDPKKIVEEEILNYADKRVRHSKVVTLKERFEDLTERYGKDKASIEMINSLEQKARKIEKKIFSNLDFTPEELPKLLKRRHRLFKSPLSRR
ncbi:MAG: HD domain-containing protein [Candidatus Freyarchaeota archaeon]